MSLFLDPTGLSTYGLGICGRCSRKMSLTKLRSDINSPGLMVCEEDADVLDPYMLPPRETESAVLLFVRPDESLAVDPSTVVNPA